MQTIVADCSPLIALSAIHRLSLLHSIFGKVFVPPVVYCEAVVDGQGWINAYGLQAALAQATWLSVHRLPTNVLPGLLHLGAGEAEAITLAKELALPVLIDERKGRTAAGRHSVEFFGTLGVLARAKDLRLITEAQPLVKSIEKAGCRFHPTLITRFLESVGEA